MYLHLGRDVVVMRRDILAVFDMDTSTYSKHTRAFLTACQQKGRVINVSDDIPKSAVLCAPRGEEAVVYISQLSSQTLLKRSKEPTHRRL